MNEFKVKPPRSRPPPANEFFVSAPKTKVWNPRALPLPGPLARAEVPDLTCVGSTLPYVRNAAGADPSADPARASFSPTAAPQAARDHLDAYLAALRRLRGHGLRAQDELVLLRTFASGAALHHARAHLLDEAWCQAYDAAVLGHVHEILRPFTGHQTLPDDARDLALLPGAGGGLGLQGLAHRRLPAYVGAWQACLAGVCSELGLPSLEAFQRACPTAWGAAEGAGRALQVRGATWLCAAAEPQAKAQRTLATPEQHARRQRLLGALPPTQAAQLRSASGKGAGSWLLPPTEDDHLLADAHLMPALAQRLRLLTSCWEGARRRRSVARPV